MRVLVWHVHGAWSTAFVQGRHTYLVPATPDRGPDGRGRARTYPWPENAVEVKPEQLRDAHLDAVVLQRPSELALTQEWTGRRPGADLPAVYVEHDTPRGPSAETVHPLADREDIPIAHVTHFNEVYWNCGRAPTTVVEHGIVDPGYRYTGAVERIGVVINEPVRRARITGADLLPRFATAAPLDVYGMRVAGLREFSRLPRDQLELHEDLPQADMHAQLATRRLYLHPFRWTSLGLSLLEAMYLGMPVAALAATEALEAVPPEAGVVSTRLDVLAEAARELLGDPDLARQRGKSARVHARERYSLERFLAACDGLLQEVTR